ncbi:MAG TPA: Ig-like domain-containing protein [Solirubrobacteraceae bacterium]|nr:Ig-like domain-containing protein [Solirubrobacteraceae bacterium]
MSALTRILLRTIARRTVPAVVALLVCAAGAAGWMAGSLLAGSNAATQAGSLPQGATPAVSLSGSSSVQVSWSQSTVGGRLLGSYPGGGYTVQRYAAAGGGPYTPGSGCSGTIAGSSATLTCTETGVPAGSWYYRITPVLNSWTGLASPASAGVSTGVATDTLTASANPATVGSAVTFTATVTGSGPTPTGSVTFKDAGTAISSCGTGGVVTLSSGAAICTVSYPATGSHAITAAYSGDATYGATAGNTLSETVGQGTPTDTVTASASPGYVNGSVTYTATVTGPGATPTGSVTFKDGGTTISTCGTSGVVALSGGVATCSVTYAATGSHAITAGYGGDANYLAVAGNTLSESIIKRTPTVSLSASANPVLAGTPVTYAATVSGAGALPTGTVTFKDGGTAIGTCGTSGVVTMIGGMATCSVTYSTVGSHSITASYSGDSNYSSLTSSTLTELVRTISTTAVAASYNPVAVGAQVTYTATVTGSSGTPTGSVTFEDGGAPVSACGTSGVVTLTSGSATCAVAYASAGTHLITAVYSGDTTFITSTSTALAETASTDSNALVQSAPADSSQKVSFQGTATDGNVVTVYYCTGTLSSCSSGGALGSLTATPSGSGSSYTWKTSSVTLTKGTAYTSQAYQTDPLGLKLASAAQHFTA